MKNIIGALFALILLAGSVMVGMLVATFIYYYITLQLTHPTPFLLLTQVGGGIFGAILLFCFVEAASELKE